MKFGKELASQLVPEWEEAYMNYNYLKSLLKDIHGFRQRSKPVSSTPSRLGRSNTLYRAFSGLTRRHSGSWSPPLGRNHDLEDQQVILTKSVKHEEGGYMTEFLRSHDEGGEYELVFFRRLDDEFNKVYRFYKGKVDEVLKEAVLLNRQMEALIAFRIRVEDPEGSVDLSVEMGKLRTTIESSSSAVVQSGPSSGSHRDSGRHHMDVIEESELSHPGISSEDPGEYTVVDTEASNNNNELREEKSRNLEATRPAPLKILERVKLKNHLETPYSTIKGVIKRSTNHKLIFKQNELRRIEEQLKYAFIEFYHKLRLLKSYSFLNILAFSKIMKKYDKITSRKASRSYLKMVDDSYLGSSEEVNKLMERVEVTFIKYFANGNRSKGIRNLRPSPKKEKHRITFSLGFFSGCIVALMLALILIVRARKIIEKDNNGVAVYMETMFRLYSLFGFVVLHMLMYGGNIYFWRRYRVNYSFIFGFRNGTELNYREVFLLSTILGTLAFCSVLANFDMEMDPKTQAYKAVTELLPLGLVCLVLVVVFLPLNYIYRSTRFFLLRCAFHSLCAPLYKVTLPDFILADQLTSQVQAFRSLEFYICYYGWGDFRHRKNSCESHPVYITFNFIIASVPYWIRFLQCLRRFFEEKDALMGYNSLKYFSTIVAVCMRTAYNRDETSVQWRVMAWTSSAIAGIVSTYWDLVIDWGLLQRHSRNRWLRDKLLVPRKSVYFGAIVLNVVLRFAWLQTVLNFKIPHIHPQALIAIVGSLEIIRRGVWNFFRLENEHLNNVGKYRAFKSVPYPFNYDDDDDKSQ